MKVFWSWQSDLPEKDHHYFIRDALELALTQVSSDLDLEEAQRPELDHDTKGEPGLVSIVDTIFEKIGNAAVFVGDLTYVGKTSNGREKLLPNPNVMIELGHALTSLGPERIVLVSNRAYGARPEDLPFDLRHRRAPITYELAAGATSSERTKAKRGLANSLAVALAGCLGRAIDESAKSVVFPSAPARQGDRSTWLMQNEEIQHHEFFHGGGIENWEVLEAPRFYMRVIPSRYDGVRTSREIHDLRSSGGIKVLDPWSTADGGVNSQGVISVGISHDRVVHAATQWFRSTGEVWAFNGAASFRNAEQSPRLLSWGIIPRSWRQHLNDTLAFLDRIEVNGPFQVEAGVTGLADVEWGEDFGQNYTALQSEIYLQRVDAKWLPDARMQFLTEVFNLLREAYNRPTLSVEKFAALY